jgi:hypothetical protein
MIIVIVKVMVLTTAVYRLKLENAAATRIAVRLFIQFTAFFFHNNTPLLSAIVPGFAVTHHWSPSLSLVLH